MRGSLTWGHPPSPAGLSLVSDQVAFEDMTYFFFRMMMCVFWCDSWSAAMMMPRPGGEGQGGGRRLPPQVKMLGNQG